MDKQQDLFLLLTEMTDKAMEWRNSHNVKVVLESSELKNGKIIEMHQTELEYCEDKDCLCRWHP